MKIDKNFTILMSVLALLGPTSWAANQDLATPPDVEGLKKTLLCSNFTIYGEELTFSAMEKRLICGIPKDEMKTQDPAWVKIPFNQLKFHLTNFLQERGYHFPRFGQRGDKKWVRLGEQTLVSSIRVIGANSDKIQVEKRRDIVGSALNPKLLETLENWVFEKLQSIGYGCPEVHSLGNAVTGEIVLRINTGDVQNIESLIEDPILGLAPGTLSRYYAFKFNKPINGDELSISRNRISALGYVESNHFIETCNKNGIALKHIVVPGPPRLLTAGFGLNTDEIVRGKVSWMNSRVDENGSLLNATLSASFITQEIKTNLYWYLFPYISRKHINSELSLTHRIVPTKNVFSMLTQSDGILVETATLAGQFGFETTFDWEGLSGSWFVGPRIDLSRTLIGVGAPTAKYMFIENRFSINTHDFEYHANDPRSGYSAGISLGVSDPGFVSDAFIQKININLQHYWNYKNLDPPLWVFSLRGGFTTLIVPQSALDQSLLPANYYQYLGGANSLRGFQTIEAQNKNLTSAFISLGLKVSNSLPYGIEPLIFLDIGALGNKSLVLNSSIYSSPGLGIQWKSPIGILKATVAPGIEDLKPIGWWPGFSFGGEF